jgi:hypothetical protein
VVHDTLERSRHRVTERRERRRLLAQDRRHRLGAGGAFERPLAREHLEEHDAEGEDVRPVVHRVAANLLGRHVADRAHHHAGLGSTSDHRRRRRLAAAGADRRDLAGETEVEDLHVPVARDEHVLGLQVAMDDALRMRGREALGNLTGVFRGALRRERPGFERLAKRLSLEQLHDGEVLPRGFAEIVNGEDVRMRERRDGHGLALEPRAGVGVGGEAWRKDLDGDVAIQLRVAGAIDLAHAAGTE